MLYLPKKYLSYSAIELWLQSPSKYRKKYYENATSHASPEMAFGKQIALLLENADSSLAHIKQYSQPEYLLDITIEDVPFIGYIDSYEPSTHAFLEYKTGHAPWDAIRVHKHLQLSLYSLALEVLHGKVQDECELIWMQTEKIAKKQLGLTTHEESHGIKLTGVVETFPRVIKQWERDRLREQLVEIATAISEDYQTYKNRPKRGDLGLR